MRKLKNRSLVPPDSYRYTDPISGHQTESSTYGDWIEAARQHRIANGFDVPLDFTGQMEDQLCGSIPPEWCEREAGDVASWVNTRFSWTDVQAGMVAFSEWGRQGLPLVDEAEANRRARICVTCPLNVHVSGCAACHKIASILTGLVAKKVSQHDDQLKACAVCHCANRAQIWFPLDVLDSKNTPEKQAALPSFCWQKAGGENREENFSH